MSTSSKQKVEHTKVENMYKKLSDYLWELKMEHEYMHDELRYARHYLPEMEEAIRDRILVLDGQIRLMESIINKLIKQGVQHGLFK
jgi:hypothetical protein